MSKSSEYYDHAGNLVTVRNSRSRRVQCVNYEPSRTIQSDREGVELSSILQKFKVTGQMTNLRSDAPIFADVSDLPDYQTYRQQIIDADMAFESLPSALRKRFGNDPANLLGFLQNESNRAEAVKLGLIPEPTAPDLVLTPPNDDVSGG